MLNLVDLPLVEMVFNESQGIVHADG